MSTGLWSKGDRYRLIAMVERSSKEQQNEILKLLLSMEYRISLLGTPAPAPALAPEKAAPDKHLSK